MNPANARNPRQRRQANLKRLSGWLLRLGHRRSRPPDHGEASPLRAMAKASQHQIRVERTIAIVRLAVLIALLPLIWWDAVSPESEVALIGLTVLLCAYLAVMWYVVPRLRWTPQQDFILSIDILAIAALVGFTDGIRSPLLFLFYLPILAAAIRVNLRQTLLSAIAVSSIVVWMWSVGEGGLSALGSSTLRVAVFTLGSLLTAAFFGVLAQETRLSGERAQLNQILQEKLAAATEQLRHRVAELEFSYGLSRRLAFTTETAAVLTTAVDAARRHMRAPAGAAFLYDRSGGKLSLAAVDGIAADDATPIMQACGEGFTERTRTPMAVRAKDGTVWSRGIAAPIVADGRLLGVLCAGGNDGWTAPQDAINAMGHIADQAAVALERASLLEDLQRLALANPEARLFNREQLDRILREEVRRAAQLSVPFALLKVHVVEMRDGRVHNGEAADLLHKHIAAMILETCRRVDVVAHGRRGEYFVLLSMATGEAATHFAGRLQKRVHTDPAVTRLLGDGVGPTCRIGIAAFPDDGVTEAELHHSVDNALEVADAERAVVLASELTR